MDKYIGKKLDGRYEIKELIGYGGMAIVFRAFDLAENREVAIKILKEEYMQNEEFKRRFRNESKAISLLSHPNIVNVFDVGFGEHSQYIVMEFIDGITLKEYIVQQKVVRWKEAIHFTVQILRALQLAHDNGIVHRDIKPQNVMLLRDGTIKVMDFGIARFERDREETVSDKALGSVHYISPEQAKGDYTDPKADIYSTGIMLYEMVTGRVPFDGDTPVGIAIQHMKNQAVMVRELNSEVPIGLEEIITRAMQKDAVLRYQTATEMLKDIDELKSNPEVIFGYRYLNEDGSTKYFDALSEENRGDAVKKKSYTIPILAGIALTCVIVAVVAIFLFFKGLDNKPNDVTLENLAGLSVQEVENKYPSLEFVIADEVMSSEYEKGLIISSNPPKDTPVKEGAEIKLTISSGKTKVIIPEGLVNKKFDDAKKELIALGIPEENIYDVQKFDETVVAGNVISTNPAANQEISVEDQIVLFVSMGDADVPTTVPSVIGKKEDDGRKTLQNANLIPIAEKVDSTEPEGTIIHQSINAGERVKNGSKIVIKVSNGKIPEKEIKVSVPFPKQAINKKFKFEIYLDGVVNSSATANPSLQQFLDVTVKGKDKNVTMVVQTTKDGKNINYAKYKLDFTKGTATLQGSVALSALEEIIPQDVTISVNVQMPGAAVDKNITFTYYLGENPLGTANVNPATSNGFVVDVKGQTGNQTLIVYANIDGTDEIYATYNVDFDGKSYTLVNMDEGILAPADEEVDTPTDDFIPEENVDSTTPEGE